MRHNTESLPAVAELPAVAVLPAEFPLPAPPASGKSRPICTCSEQSSTAQPAPNKKTTTSSVQWRTQVSVSGQGTPIHRLLMSRVGVLLIEARCERFRLLRAPQATQRADGDDFAFLRQQATREQRAVLLRQCQRVTRVRAELAACSLKQRGFVESERTVRMAPQLTWTIVRSFTRGA